MIISVTEEDIANGKRQTCDSCPIALAVKRAYPGCPVSVDQWGIKIAGCRMYRVNDQMYKFMTDFDLCGPKAVKPFLFVLK